MNIGFLGGASEVGASCILVKFKEKNILMDSGIRQGVTGDTLPNFRAIQESGGVDAIIISHGHMDHIGSLPIIAKEYPLAKVYCNNMTKDLMRVLLYDSIKIMNGREAEIPLYSEGDVENLLNRTYTYNFENTFQVVEGISCTLYMAGHIPGASCIYLTSEEGSVFYSGDFSLFPQIAVEGAKFPKLRPDIAILESTYGDKLHSSRKLEEEKLVSVVKERILNGGKVLIPAFALGRSQEVILILKKAMNNGIIPKTKIFVDGMVRDINIVFKRNPLYLKGSLCKKILSNKEPFYDDNIVSISKTNSREEVVKSKEPCIVVSSSGMLTGGPSQFYAEHFLGDEKNTIIISGYQDEESPGRKLLNLYDSPPEDRRFELGGKSIPVKSLIEKVSLSAHGDKSEIKAVVERLNPKNVFLVHGDKNVIKALGNEMTKESFRKIYIPLVGDSYEIDIYNPRKQFRKKLSFRMNKFEELTEEGLRELREFILKNYGKYPFTAEELLFIWGEKEEEDISKYQFLLTKSVYFKNDGKRLFMFLPSEESELLEEQKKREPSQTEVHDSIKEALNKFDLRKVSLILDKKKVLLNFDFPKALNKDIYEEINILEEKFNWKIEIKEQTNINAIDSLVMEIIGYDEISKISHNLSDNTVVLKLNRERDISVKQQEFYEKTGFKLVLKDSNQNFEGNKTLNKDAIDQNELIRIIDIRFKDVLYKPYKKSVVKIGYMKLAFISPEVGERNRILIEEIALNSGWNIEVSNSYNQNDILNITESACRELNIDLKKRPAFIHDLKSIKIQCSVPLHEEELEKLSNLIYSKTGLPVIA